jgi:hypothetical protein
VQRGSALIRPSLEGGAARAGEAIAITITPSIPAGRNAWYAYRPAGGSLLGGDPPAPFVYRAYGAGGHVIGFMAVDDRCVVSPVLEITLTVEAEE